MTPPSISRWWIISAMQMRQMYCCGVLLPTAAEIEHMKFLVSGRHSRPTTCVTLS
jgi:hypothetical protein